MPQSIQIVIVGGGVGGLSTALALACRGIPSQVLEARDTPGDIDRGDILQKSSIRLLEQWGAAELLRSYGASTFPRFLVVDSTGSALFEFDGRHDLIPPVEFTALEHPCVERMLESAVSRSGLASIRRGVRGLDLVLRDNRVVGVATTDGIINADLVVIACGASSPLVERFFNVRVFRYGVAYYNALCERAFCPRDAGFYVLGRNGVLVMAPLSGNRTRLVLQTELDSQARPTPAWAEAEARYRLETLPSGSLEITRTHTYIAMRTLADSFWRPGAVVLGDAAHTTHPAGGQGMNLAFRDAETLAALIAHGSGGHDVDTIVRRYANERRHAAKAVLRLTHALGRAATLIARPGANLRGQIIRFANHIPAVKRSVFRRLCWTA